jgi:hypothetical protein
MSYINNYNVPNSYSYTGTTSTTTDTITFYPNNYQYYNGYYCYWYPDLIVSHIFSSPASVMEPAAKDAKEAICDECEEERGGYKFL